MCKINNTEKRLKILVEDITFKTITNDESLYTSNLIDSMGTIDLAVMIEIEFGIKINTNDIIVSNFDSLEKLTTYVQSKLIS